MRQTLARLGMISSKNDVSSVDNRGKPDRFDSVRRLRSSARYRSPAVLDRRAFLEPAAPFIPTLTVSAVCRTA